MCLCQLDHSYAATGAEVTVGKVRCCHMYIYLQLCMVYIVTVQDPVLHCGDDKIYEDPATSVTGLYAQFEKIKITIIPSSEIE